jgi:hypothetical protein
VRNLPARAPWEGATGRLRGWLARPAAEGEDRCVRKSLDRMRDERIRALIKRLTGQLRLESNAVEASRGRLLQSELEKSLPADVPLHKRGFGVMDDAVP